MQGGWVGGWRLRRSGIGLRSFLSIGKYGGIDKDCRANKGNEVAVVGAKSVGESRGAYNCGLESRIKTRASQCTAASRTAAGL